MKILRTIQTVLQALQRNLMRAMLSTLGIVIGVAAIIAMMEIGKKSSSAVKKSIASMGANTILVHPGTAASGGISFGAGSGMNLTSQDNEAIIRECPSVHSAAPEVRARTQVVYGNRNWVPSSIVGTTPSLLEVRDWTSLAEGDVFSDRDVLNANKVCVLGQTLVRELFQGESPVGKEIRIKNVSFRVVGVLTGKGANMMGSDQDDILLAPWTTIKYRVTGSPLANTNQSSTTETSSTVNSLSQLYPGGKISLYPVQSAIQAADNPMPVRFTNIDHILVAAVSTEEIPAAIQQIKEVLRERHRIRTDEADDFNIRDMTEITKTLSATTALMTNLLLTVALISLVVGGVGIMNIMLVSVTERTREIGLRMAVAPDPVTSSGNFCCNPLSFAWREEAWAFCWAMADPSLSSGFFTACRKLTGSHCRCSHRLCRCEYCFRLLSGMESIAAGPDRNPALRVRGKPPALVLVRVETTGLVFALDSIPATLGIMTKEFIEQMSSNCGNRIDKLFEIKYHI